MWTARRLGGLRVPVANRSGGRSRPEQVPSVASDINEDSHASAQLVPWFGDELHAAVRIRTKAFSKSSTLGTSQRGPRTTEPASCSPSAWARSSAVVAPGDLTTTQRCGRPSLVKDGELEAENVDEQPNGVVVVVHE